MKSVCCDIHDVPRRAVSVYIEDGYILERLAFMVGVIRNDVSLVLWMDCGGVMARLGGHELRIVSVGGV